jgi:hypothetical protein
MKTGPLFGLETQELPRKSNSSKVLSPRFQRRGPDLLPALTALRPHTAPVTLVTHFLIARSKEKKQILIR